MYMKILFRRHGGRIASQDFSVRRSWPGRFSEGTHRHHGMDAATRRGARLALASSPPSGNQSTSDADDQFGWNMVDLWLSRGKSQGCPTAPLWCARPATACRRPQITLLASPRPNYAAGCRRSARIRGI